MVKTKKVLFLCVLVLLILCGSMFTANIEKTLAQSNIDKNSTQNMVSNMNNVVDIYSYVNEFNYYESIATISNGKFDMKKINRGNNFQNNSMYNLDGNGYSRIDIYGDDNITK